MWLIYTVSPAHRASVAAYMNESVQSIVGATN